MTVIQQAMIIEDVNKLLLIGMDFLKRFKPTINLSCSSLQLVINK